MEGKKLPLDLKVLEPLMYNAGLTLHASQQFDYCLKLVVYYLSKLELIKLKIEDAAQIIDGGKKKTTGQVFHILREQFPLEKNSLSAMKLALDTRNRFIHGFLTDSNTKIANPASRGDVENEIKSMRKIISDGESAALRILKALLNLYGIDLNELDREVQEETRMMNEENGK